MINIPLSEILSFFKQVGLALSGASCLWGIYFFIKSKKAKTQEKVDVFLETSKKMTGPLSVGIFIVAASWVLFEIFYPVLIKAHEGISIIPDINSVKLAFIKTTPIFISLLVVYAIGLIIKRLYKDKFFKNIHIFYGIEFILASILISFPAWTGTIGSEQFFLAGHGFHSILTLGTVLILDFIFVLTKYSESFEKNLYPNLVTISKVIWLGLALDFLSVVFIFHEAVANTPKFIFMQTVIAIIIINGALLSGPITKKLMEVAEDNSIDEPSPFWDKIITISGSVSVASWITVTFTDVITNIEISYPSMIGVYLGFIVLVYLSYELLEHYKIGSRW